MCGLATTVMTMLQESQRYFDSNYKIELFNVYHWAGHILHNLWWWTLDSECRHCMVRGKHFGESWRLHRGLQTVQEKWICMADHQLHNSLPTASPERNKENNYCGLNSSQDTTIIFKELLEWKIGRWRSSTFYCYDQLVGASRFMCVCIRPRSWPHEIAPSPECDYN